MLEYKVPDLGKDPLKFVLEDLDFKHDGIWLEFGVFSGSTINYISKFTDNVVYGFDSFRGLPEDWRQNHLKGEFDMGGTLPIVNNNVVLIEGLFQDTLEKFLKKTDKKISFVHIDCDLYSSTKYVLDTISKYMADECIIVFDEIFNFNEYDGAASELRALQEFILENEVKTEWIGMNGVPYGMHGRPHQNAAVRLIMK